MDFKVKYGKNGACEAEMRIYPNQLRNKARRKEYLEMHDFLTDMFRSAEQDTAATATANGPVREKRPHNKSVPHYKADSALAKTIIDAGGLNYLHGVHIINGEKIFFFDKSDLVKEMISSYNSAESSGDEEVSVQDTGSGTN